MCNLKPKFKPESESKFESLSLSLSLSLSPKSKDCWWSLKDDAMLWEQKKCSMLVTRLLFW